MGSNWPLIKLGDFVEIQTGNPFKSKSYSEIKGVRLLRGDNIVQGTFRWANVKYWPEDLISEKEKQYFLDYGDVILAMDRPWIEAGLKTAQINESDLPCLLVQRTARLKAKNLRDQDFLKHLISSNRFVQYVKQVQTGTAVPHISSKQIKDFEFNLPPLSARIVIGKVMKTLDSKIHVNQQTNQTLEQMAQALFKSWFVDFDPVFDNLLASVDFKLENLENRLPDELKQKAQRRLAALNSLENAAECKASLSALAHELQALSPTKKATQAAVQVSEKAAETPVKANFNGNPKILVQHANTHAHFPNEFEHNEQLGWIPKGWEVNQLSEITTELRRGISPKYIEEGGVQVINQKCIRNHEVNFTPCRRNNTELRKITGRELNVGDLLINSTGVGTLGRMAQVKYLNEVTVVDSHVTVVRADSEIYPVYSFAQMMLSIEDKIEALGHGSTGQTELSRKTVSEQWVLVPKSKALNHLNSQLISISEKIVLNSRQINELTKLRDTLLPKLISGELQIPDVATDEEIVD